MSTLSLDGTMVPVGTYPMDVQATGSFNAQVATVELDGQAGPGHAGTGPTFRGH